PGARHPGDGQVRPAVHPGQARAAARAEGRRVGLAVDRRLRDRRLDQRARDRDPGMGAGARRVGWAEGPRTAAHASPRRAPCRDGRRRVIVALVVPMAHLGHALPLLPYFGPPLLITAGIFFLAVKERLRGGEDDYDGGLAPEVSRDEAEPDGATESRGDGA